MISPRIASPSVALAPAVLFAVCGCAGEPGGGGGATFPAEALVTVEGAEGAVTLEVRTAPAQPPERGVSTVEYRATAGGEPLDGLDLEVLPWMPDMGHGASSHVTVVAEGGGRYVVSGVTFTMPGRWELRTTISGAVRDVAIVPLQIP